jgi:hypothetical protein
VWKEKGGFHSSCQLNVAAGIKPDGRAAIREIQSAIKYEVSEAGSVVGEGDVSGTGKHRAEGDAVRIHGVVLARTQRLYETLISRLLHFDAIES